jgi:hypothetical protein
MIKEYPNSCELMVYSSFSESSSTTIIGCIFFLISADRFYWDAWDPVHVSEAMLALGNILNFTRLFHLLAINEHLGPMLISLERMIKVSSVDSFFLRSARFAINC